MVGGGSKKEISGIYMRQSTLDRIDVGSRLLTFLELQMQDTLVKECLHPVVELMWQSPNE
jgi:hypothetical protein